MYDGAGREVARTDPSCNRGDRLGNLALRPGQRYSFVVMGAQGEPYGSWRGGKGIHITRPDGKAVLGFDADPVPGAKGHFVRAVGPNFYLGCEQFAFVGCNTWDLMDTARRAYLRWRGDSSAILPPSPAIPPLVAAAARRSSPRSSSSSQ